VGIHENGTDEDGDGDPDTYATLRSRTRPSTALLRLVLQSRLGQSRYGLIRISSQLAEGVIRQLSKPSGLTPDLGLWIEG